MMTRHASFRALGLVVGVIAVASCSTPNSSSTPLGENKSAIAIGTSDTTHTAVVTLLGDAGGGSYFECTGTIVQVKGGVGYVLTSAHCCGDGQRLSVLVTGNDYTPGIGAVTGGPITPPAYSIMPSSIIHDSAYVIGGDAHQPYDFCMLQFAAPAGTPAIPVAIGSDGVAVGASADAVGYGVIQGGSNNTLRRSAVVAPDSITSLLLNFSPDAGTPGTCSGDSGGPLLMASGAAQATQQVVGVTSRPEGNCGDFGQSTGAVRVTSETGPGGFISSYLADTPFGTRDLIDGGVEIIAPPDAGSDGGGTGGGADASAEAGSASDGGATSGGQDASATADSNDGSTDDGGGCSLVIADRNSDESAYFMLFGAIGLVLARRRR